MEKEWIDIAEASYVLLGNATPVTDTDKGNVRVILRHFKVESKDAHKADGAFGKPAKLYKAEQVKKVATFKL